MRWNIGQASLRKLNKQEFIAQNITLVMWDMVKSDLRVKQSCGLRISVCLLLLLVLRSLVSSFMILPFMSREVPSCPLCSLVLLIIHVLYFRLVRQGCDQSSATIAVTHGPTVNGCSLLFASVLKLSLTRHLLDPRLALNSQWNQRQS